jgi:hypothetical protein
LFFRHFSLKKVVKNSKYFHHFVSSRWKIWDDWRRMGKFEKCDYDWQSNSFLFVSDVIGTWIPYTPQKD